MFDPLRFAELPGPTHMDAAQDKREAVADIQTALLDCLTRLDALNIHVAAAHLSMCIDALDRDFNPD